MRALIVSTLVAVAQAVASLDEVCTTAYAQSILPEDGIITGITFDASSVVASATTNYSSASSDFFPAANFDFCAIQFAYSHAGLDDTVLLEFWLPSPVNFQNRYLSTGGGGMAINSGNDSLPGGVQYGAVSGITDGGFGSFDNEFDSVFLLANGTVNWPSVFMFGYQAHHEMTVIGKQLTRNFYGMADSTKLYAYYQACSEGGREGWSQIQRYDEWDGAVVGAPAFRFAFQQVAHLWSAAVEKQVGYAPPPCELTKILNLTIAACDPLDGRTDGVVSRTDLCKLHFDLKTTIGEEYSCAASSGGMGSSAAPAQTGKVSAKAVEIAEAILNGPKNSKGQQMYFSYQPSATWSDAQTTYNSDTGEWEVEASGIGAEWVTRFLNLLNSSSLSMDDVSYDAMQTWIMEGWQMYEDTLQTTWPDLSTFHGAGGKVLHIHGESDYSVPTASSVRYWDSVRSVMYPDLSFTKSADALNDWYRLFLVPGAGHCSPSSDQLNGPFPQTTLKTLIEWVENGVFPTQLNATVLQGDNEGEEQTLCAWPLRPLWTKKGTVMECVYDQTSLDTWSYDLDAFDLPVY
ncbi:hypothetical protein ASPZODRAFT_128862 [Penicilliopsis zonata CBS 506.65]|uniref:Carboxylic ester hydrolase n=1 Tax=Penicilliopsis zonata CBS 506.65 TaxID=1073090 RepID=A0A1L9SSX7_9EURO|nr:hypothetical protein ASPZODRAFT_128862 [Penicilliopsis zonata CBS 506.65]OJJ50236.1 hypothetical protein ASPZODRAFT_128862 [Penicilliopsis zonata CBS 506.65]